jgi:hypothetical protein
MFFSGLSLNASNPQKRRLKITNYECLGLGLTRSSTGLLDALFRVTEYGMKTVTRVKLLMIRVGVDME